MSQLIAKIAVSAATYHIDKLYDYLIAENADYNVSPGIRVLVPFGRGNKKVEGIILSICSASKLDELKSIDSYIDKEPVINDENIRLALWMRDRFFCTVYDALRCMLPVKRKSKTGNSKLNNTTLEFVDSIHIELSNEQQTVYDELVSLLKSGIPKAALLIGVTGSGKTIVFIQLIKTVLEMGKTAIVLVPEIALTPQTVNIFKVHFGNSVAVLHSGLSESERYNEWNRIRSGSVSVVVGTRSAVFAPLSNIGLIIIDEEQEHTYKSEKSPRYHAREIAKFRITRSSGLLLMASATPSIESMYAAKKGRYELLRLKSRYNERDLPPVIITDMKDELRAGNGGQISSVLRYELEKNIDRGEQSILFINRRGASTAAICGECGYTYKCRNCSVSMTYHITGKRLLCHHCGYTLPVPCACSECGGKLKFIGAGTQKVETELTNMFPDISIIRMDADTTTRKNAHNTLLSDFRNSRAHVLLGTQMVTKGLDFENVTLVGVLCADSSLYMSDYRANEKTFSLITQVIGRSGRGVKPGRAVIQTFTPDNNVIKLASQQDYDSFFDSEIQLRSALGNPPVRDLLTLTATGTDENAVVNTCDTLKANLYRYTRDVKDVKILGPAPAPVSKINNKYLYRLMVSCVNTKNIREILAHILKEFAYNKKSRGIVVFADTE